MQDDSHIAKTLKRIRLERLWTLKKMANAIGMPLGSYWNIESERCRPTALTQEKIRRAFPEVDRSVA